MERRYVTFIILAGLILMTNQLIVGWFKPRAPQIAANNAARCAERQATRRSAGRGRRRGRETDGRGKSRRPEPQSKLDANAADGIEKPEDKIPVQRLSLGSYLATSGYRLLVTLNNEGAAVERIELTSPQYRDLEDRSGYLGHLAPADAPNGGGCLVQVVGRGTPADTAGMKVGRHDHPSSAQPP